MHRVPGAPSSNAFNFGNPLLDMFGNMAAEPLFNALGMQPGEFFPTRNVHDQQMARNYKRQAGIASAHAARVDRQGMLQVFAGLHQSMTGRAPTAAEQTYMNSFGDLYETAVPMAAGMFPDTMDAMLGSRGSASVAASRYMQAGQIIRDPITGQIGMSGQSVGAMAGMMANRFFGSNSDLSKWNGFGQGRAALLYEGLAARGMVPETRAEDAFSIAGTKPGSRESSQALLERLGSMDPAALDSFAGAVRDKVKARGGDTRPTGNMAAGLGSRGQPASAADRARFLAENNFDDVSKVMEDLGKDPANPLAQKFAHASSTAAVAKKLQDMTGAIAAVRDLFSANGHGNAPMPELMAGLDALTQGGMATGDNDRLQRDVRRMHSLGNLTGITVDAQAGLHTRGAQLADSLGISRDTVAATTNEAILRGDAYGRNGGIIGRGAMSKEQMTVVQQQLGMQANQSGAANNLGVIMRAAEVMENAGTSLPPQMRAIVAAIKDPDKAKGKYVDPVTGETRSLNITQDQATNIITAGGTMSRATAQAMVGQRDANAEYGTKHDIGTRTVAPYLQAEEGRAALANSMDGVFRNHFAKTGFSDAVNARLVAGAKKDAAKATTDMDATVYADPKQREAAMDANYVQSVSATLAQNGISLNDRRAKALLDPKRRVGLVNAAHGTLEKSAREAGLPSANAWVATLRPGTAATAAATREQALIEDGMRDLLAGLGTAGPIARIADALQGAPEDASTTIGRVLGGISGKDVRAKMIQYEAHSLGRYDLKPEERAALLSDGVAASARRYRDSSKLKGKAGEEARAAEKAHVEALMTGGAAAKAELAKLFAGKKIDPKLYGDVILNPRSYRVDQEFAARAQELHTAMSGGLASTATELGLNAGPAIGRTPIKPGAAAPAIPGLTAPLPPATGTPGPTSSNASPATTGTQPGGTTTAANGPMTITGTVTLVDNRTANVDVRPISSGTSPV